MNTEIKAISPVATELERTIPLILKSKGSNTLIGLEEKTTDTILLNIENGIVELIKSLTRKDTKNYKYKECLAKLGLEDITDEETSHLPSSAVGIIIHYFLEGVKRDFNITFEDEPVSIKGRGGEAKKVADKARIINKKQKQDIVDGTTIEFYKDDIDKGLLTLPEVLVKIQKAYELKSHLEECGLILSPKKTDGVLYQGINYEGAGKDGGKSIAEIHEEEASKLIIQEIKNKVAELVQKGIIELPKQERTTPSK
jgi:hypothetical protein